MRHAKPVRLLGAILLVCLGLGSLSSVPATLAWFSPQSLPNVPQGKDDGVYQPRSAAQGNLMHAIFQYTAGGAYDLYYSRGTTTADGRVDWSSPRIIASGARYGHDIAVGEDGTIHVAYAGGDSLKYIKN